MMSLHITHPCISIQDRHSEVEVCTVLVCMDCAIHSQAWKFRNSPSKTGWAKTSRPVWSVINYQFIFHYIFAGNVMSDYGHNITRVKNVCEPANIAPDCQLSPKK